MVAIELLLPFSFFIALIFIIGLYCVVATFDLIRLIIGLELLIKAVTLLIIVVGYLSKHPSLAQSMVITLIVIEVVVMSIAAGVVLNIYLYNKSLDARNIRNLKG